MFSSTPEEEHKDSSTTTQSSYFSSQQSQLGPGEVGEMGDQMYQLKTMCLAKKTVQMPTKEEHGFLLFCGLGARRWQIGMDCNSLSFKQAILNIYPRLRSVIGYNLWALTKDRKNFERIPEKVNTPRRMRSYLGSLFTGCLIIVPVSDIMLMEERREHLRIRDMKEFRDLKGPPMQNMESENRLSRSSCLICGKMEKTAGTGSFHKIHTDTLACQEGEVPIVRKLGDLLGFSFDVTKKRMHVSDEICRRCMKCVKETLQKEDELKTAKAELLATFFSTTSKFSRNQVAVNETEEGELKGSAAAAAASNGGRPELSPPLPQAHHHHHHHHHPPGPDISHHPMGQMYGLPESYRQQQQQLLLQALPPTDMSSLSHKSSGYGPPAVLLPYYRSRLGLGDSASSCNRSARGGGFITNGENSSSAAGAPGDHRRGDTNSHPSGSHLNYFHVGSGSEYARSEVGSSSFISVSPPRQDYVPAGSYQQETENESRLSSSLSPRPFDTMSYASTFSLKSCNSTVWPKAPAMSGVDHHHHHRNTETTTTTTSHKRRRSASGGDEEVNGDLPSSEESSRMENECRTGNGGGGGSDARKVKREVDEDEEEEERRVPPLPLAESPPAGSLSCGSCTPPSVGSQADEKAEQQEEEEAARDRRKPWKKRRRVQESNKAASNSGPDKKLVMTGGTSSGRTDESNESNYEDQLDNSNSTSPQSRTPTA